VVEMQHRGRAVGLTLRASYGREEALVAFDAGGSTTCGGSGGAAPPVARRCPADCNYTSVRDPSPSPDAAKDRLGGRSGTLA